MKCALRFPSLAGFLAFFLFAFAGASALAQSGFAGSWRIDRALSTAIDPWGRISLEIEVSGEAVSITRTVTTGRRMHTQHYPLQLDRAVRVPVSWWTGNRHIGAYIGGDMTEEVTVSVLDDGRTLRTESIFVLATSQGETPVRRYREYRLSDDGDTLTVIELRSSRPRPILHVFKRA